MDNADQVQHDMGYRKINFKGRPEEYHLRLLSFEECAIAFSKALALLAPPCTAAFDSYQEHMNALAEEQRARDEGFEPEEVALSLFDVSVVLSQQMEKPLFWELINMLLKGLVKRENGVDKPVHLNDEFHGRFDDGLKLVEFAFMENLATPFVRWLEEKGFSGMITSLQQAITAKKAQTS